MVLALGFAFSAQAQDSMKKETMSKEVAMKKDAMMKDTKTQVISLEQTAGEFTQKSLTLEAGTYVFEISNKNVGHAVGFVLAPKSNPDAHIQTAYVTKAVEDGKTESSKATSLAKGEYVYFCPLNPTPQYTLIVN